jgi:hypothetical protein
MTALYRLMCGPLNVAFDDEPEDIQNVWYLFGWNDSDSTSDYVHSYGFVDGKCIPEADTDGAKLWAEAFIGRNTKYHMNGWDGDGFDPALFEFVHELEFEMSTGATIDLTVDAKQAEQLLYGKSVARHRMEHDNGTVEVLHINMDHVVQVTQTISQVRRILEG